MIGDITTLLLKKGFRHAKSNLPNVSLFYHSPEELTMEFCVLVNNKENNTPLTSEFLAGLCNSIERNFLLNGTKKVNFFFLILSDYIERDKSFLNLKYPFWIIDCLEDRILIYDNQPNDFYQLKQPLEKVITQKPKLFAMNKTKYLPIVTIFLVIINIVLFLVTNASAEGSMAYYLYQHGGAYWKLIFEEKEFYRLLTCMFLHFSADHLMNNMIVLALIGKETEAILGHIRFLFIYILSGLGASVMSSLYYMHNLQNEISVSAGASGAIFGILGALIIVALLYPQCRKEIHPANIILITILSISNGLLSTSVDNVGHIGGLMFGIIITFISCLCRKNILK